MKGHPDILITLNSLLAEELTAINQYMVHSEMDENWHYEYLHKAVEKRAFTEMKHAERLIERILFLDGSPTVSRLNEIHIGATVEAQLNSDLDAELVAVHSYNKAIRQAADLGDNGTKDLLDGILPDEEAHVDWIEAQLAQIQQMGLPSYLAQQVHEE